MLTDSDTPIPIPLLYRPLIYLPSHCPIAIMAPPKDGTPPDDDHSCFAIGIVTFCAKLSPSFATFTIQRAIGGPLDIIVARKRADSCHAAHLASIVEEVERCRQHAIPVVVHGYMPYERCSCQENCKYCIMHCWNVNDLSIPEPQPLLCQLISNPIPPPPPPTLKESESEDNTNGPKKRKRVDVKNRGRAARFVELLIDLLGPEQLKASSVGVLDVAGGAGGTTFELSLRREIPCTVIDPRPVKLNRTQRNTLKFRKDNREKLRQGLEVSHCANVLYKRFREWQPSQMQALFDEDFAASEEGDRMLRECTAVVGMHPDEATDAIIELAIRYNKPWMVCPCCVFPHTFKRTLPNGKAVRKYDELCEYIKNICEDVEEEVLDFEGRNKVYYWLPKEYRRATNEDNNRDAVT